MASQFDVVGLGLNAMDTICVLDEFPVPNRKSTIKRVFREPGGQVATALTATARLGLRSLYMGSVGNDDIGRTQLERLQAEGIDTQQVRIVDGVVSPMSIILLEDGVGERTVLWHRDSKLRYPASKLNREVVCSGRILHLDGSDTEAALQAANWAREGGIPVVIDIDAVYDDSTHELLKRVDYLIAAEEFGAKISGSSDPEVSAKCLADQYGCPVVGMTCGVRGAVFINKGAILKTAAYSIQALDTTGAGDVFHGAFIYGLLQNWKLPEIARFAHAAAALKCTKVGARSGIPTLPEVEAFLLMND